MRTRTSWKEKLERQQEAKIVTIPPRMQKRFGRGTMLIPRPLDVDALIRKVPRGKLITQAQIRRIAAEAAAEEMRAGKSRVTPYWRVIRDDGKLLEKLPGGPSAQANHLVAEGHSIETAGKLRVKSPMRSLVSS